MGNRYPQKYERADPNHAGCEGLSEAPCACNCHFDWRKLADFVRLPDGRFGFVEWVRDYRMHINLGDDHGITVDIGLPVLLDQQAV